MSVCTILPLLPLANTHLSPEFAGLADSTRTDRRRHLEKFAIEPGHKRTRKIEPKHIKAIVQARATIHPGAARNLLVILRHFLAFALGDNNPAAKVKSPAQRSLGHRTWDEADIAQFEKRWPIGSQERLALALALFTGQRRSDLVKLGRQHIKQGELRFTQTKRTKSKKPVELTIPVHPDLQKVLDATPVGDLTFLISSRTKRPFTPNAFTVWFQRRCEKAGLPPGLSPHGLRKATCRRLAESGCSAPVIASISGHKTLAEVERYIAEANRVKMARLGVKALSKPRR